ncbi:cyclic nucleotide-binding domain-containing protein [Methylomarinovum caldicuralii]|uniref:cyclic nucleotide-binding domain-containing protein n=1 Tax=Methylomarinovum caldicuralii TaxID=438856 RepID=UPI002952E566|nr:cyclic nucleotide-binding domain-containing protein [Methylomarinovum caldicuralii]
MHYAEIRRLIPLHLLPQESCKRLCKTLVPREASSGEILFERGEISHEWVYLLEGRVALEAGGIVMEELQAGDDNARFPLAHQSPRKVTARALTPLRYIRIDPQRIKPALPQEETRMTDTKPGKTQGDWMTRLLKSPIFQRLPASNLQKILQLEEKALEAGTPVILQGEVADGVFILRSGQCEVSRQPRPGGKVFKLGILKPGDMFGEDAILSGQARAVTVTMATDGVVLCLSPERFRQLVAEPVLDSFSFEAAFREVEQGAQWLDVRDPDQFRQHHIRGSLNIPFFSLRMQLTGLQRGQRYITVSEDGRLATAAAFLLLKHGFEAAVLEGGLGSVPPKCLNGEVREEAGQVEAPAPVVPPEEKDDQALEELQRHNRQLQQRLEDLDAENRDLSARLASQAEETKEKAALEAEAETLRRRVAELEAVIRDYCKAAAEMEGDDRLQALQTELEMVREQAEADVAAMRRQVEALRARCRELAQESGEGMSWHPPADWTALEPEDLPLLQPAPQADGEAARRGWVGPLLWTLVGALASLALLGIGLQSESGRRWLAQWLWDGQVAEESAPVAPEPEGQTQPPEDQDLFAAEPGAVSLDKGGKEGTATAGEAPPEEEDLFAE